MKAFLRVWDFALLPVIVTIGFCGCKSTNSQTSVKSTDPATIANENIDHGPCLPRSDVLETVKDGATKDTVDLTWSLQFGATDCDGFINAYAASVAACRANNGAVSYGMNGCQGGSTVADDNNIATATFSCDKSVGAPMTTPQYSFKVQSTLVNGVCHSTIAKVANQIQKTQQGQSTNNQPQNNQPPAQSTVANHGPCLPRSDVQETANDNKDSVDLTWDLQFGATDCSGFINSYAASVAACRANNGAVFFGMTGCEGGSTVADGNNMATATFSCDQAAGAAKTTPQYSFNVQSTLADGVCHSVIQGVASQIQQN